MISDMRRPVKCDIIFLEHGTTIDGAIRRCGLFPFGRRTFQYASLEKKSAPSLACLSPRLTARSMGARSVHVRCTLSHRKAPLCKGGWLPQAD